MDVDTSDEWRTLEVGYQSGQRFGGDFTSLCKRRVGALRSSLLAATSSTNFSRSPVGNVTSGRRALRKLRFPEIVIAVRNAFQCCIGGGVRLLQNAMATAEGPDKSQCFSRTADDCAEYAEAVGLRAGQIGRRR
jgi:hypothetical protein